MLHEFFKSKTKPLCLLATARQMLSVVFAYMKLNLTFVILSVIMVEMSNV